MSATPTFIIVGYHGERWLARCIASLAESGARRCRLVLVDNGGNGQLSALPLDQSEVVILKTPYTMGFAEANNFALQQTRPETDIVCFLNQDTVSDPGWFDACVRCLNARPEVGAVMPLLATYDGLGWDPGFEGFVGESAAFLADRAAGDLGDFYELSAVSGAAMVVRTACLRKCGPFDPLFGSYYEDVDLCRRIRKLGCKVGVCGRARVCHFSGSSTTTDDARRRRMRQIERNRAICRVREAGRSRTAAVCRQFFRTFPWNVVRGLARTPSSQPVAVQIGAHVDLLRIIGRLVSEARDQAAWEDYLEEIGWGGARVTASRCQQSGIGDGEAA